MKLTFGYGTGQQVVEVPERNLCGILEANEVLHEFQGEEAVRHALRNPIGAPLLRALVKPKQKIAIIASDISRPVPTHQILPALLEELFAAGCRREDITVVFALGSHRGHTEEEKRRLAGPAVYDMVRCVDSEPGHCVHLGMTSRGTPVDITEDVAAADVRICTGNIEFHYFAGYSGGAKALMPGVSTPEAIQQNHRMMIDPAACAGNLEENPLRQDIEEAGRIADIDYIVNVILDEHKRIVHAVAGDKIAAHRAGCAYLDRMYRKPIPKRADIVLVSQGGAPKDLNLYQVQKALDNAKHAVRPGGTIILIGACDEGMGNMVFEQWLREAPSPQSIIDRIHQKFQLGGHKAAAIAMVLQNARVDLVSELDDGLVRSIFLYPQPSAQQALDEALLRYGASATVLAMPYGGATLPTLPAAQPRA